MRTIKGLRIEGDREPVSVRRLAVDCFAVCGGRGQMVVAAVRALRIGLLGRSSDSVPVMSVVAARHMQPRRRMTESDHADEQAGDKWSNHGSH